MKGIDKKTDYGKPTMKIELKNNIFFPEDKIRGKIYLKSGNFLKNGIIIYEIFYQEKISITGKNSNLSIELRNSSQISHNSLEYPGLINYSLTKGINIPFEINIPASILPSFEFSNNPKKYGYIKYYFQIQIPEIKLIQKKFIIIRRNLIKLNSPLLFIAEKNEKILGIFNKICPTLSASYENKCCFFNEEISLKISYNKNNSKFGLKYIDVRLMRNVIFKLGENNGGKNNKNKQKKEKLNDLIFTDELYFEKKYINEKANNENIIFNVKIRVEEPEKLFNRHKVEYLDLGLEDKRQLVLYLPSLESKLEYFIRVEGIFDSIIPMENLFIKMPIFVCHKNKKNNLNNGPLNLLDSKNEKENNLNEINDNISNNKMKKEKTYTNGDEKEWNKMTNGQIIPKLYEENSE